MHFVFTAQTAQQLANGSLSCCVSGYHVSVETLAAPHTETHRVLSLTYLSSDVQMKQPIWVLMVNPALWLTARHRDFPRALSAYKSTVYHRLCNQVFQGKKEVAKLKKKLSRWRVMRRAPAENNRPDVEHDWWIIDYCGCWPQSLFHALFLCFMLPQVKIWFQNRRAKERKINRKKLQHSQQASTTTPASPALGSSTSTPIALSPIRNMLSDTVSDDY